MSHWLDKYRDCEVEVFYLTDSNFRDRGTLADYGDGWIELNKAGADPFLIPTTAIRLVRPVAPPAVQRTRLLRPAKAPKEQQERIGPTDNSP